LIEGTAVQGAGTLELLAELAVAVLGFSGVVAVLGRRASGDWTELDRTRFRNMVHTAVLALVLSLLPLPIRSAGFGEPTVWGWSSGIGTVLCVLFLVPSLTDVTRRWPWSNPAVSKPALVYVLCARLGAPLLLGLNAAGIAFARAATPYLLACLLTFGMSVVLFVRLLEVELGGGRRAV
jgi:hypothetical protein